jgi:hypothetical protein
MAHISAVKRRNGTAVAVLALAVLATVLPERAGALSDRVIHDPYTGIAIGGFDPVAYFLDRRPVPGDPAIEVVWGGAYWRFDNEGNAAAFEDAPTVFAPAYGGHGVAGVARGVPQPGDPTIFAVHRDRLFFFFAEADRSAFLADPEPLIAAADARWPAIADRLAE